MPQTPAPTALVVANWKMHGSKALLTEMAQNLAAARLDSAADNGPPATQIVLCPPAPYLAPLAASLIQAGAPGIQLGAQDLSEHPEGPHTGQISAKMLADSGCQWAIIGHSERRTQCGETSEQTATKVARALEHGLTPILCIGETLAQRKAGTTEQILSQQLAPLQTALNAAQLRKLVIAYEPIWAIGTGATASPTQAQQVHAFIRHHLDTPPRALLYGGSVKPANAPALFAEPDIDGGLIGGAALVAADFIAICRATLRP